MQLFLAMLASGVLGRDGFGEGDLVVVVAISRGSQCALSLSLSHSRELLSLFEIRVGRRRGGGKRRGCQMKKQAST